MTGPATVDRAPDGKWTVSRNGQVVAALDTNREAWRLADKLNKEPTSRREQMVDWINSKD